MKRLSATSINDFLECPQRFWFRTNHPEASKVSDHVTFGGVVHDAIEKFDNVDDALEWSLKEWPIRSQDGNFMPDKQAKKPPKSFKRQLGNYYKLIEPQIDGGDKEVFFRLPWYSGSENLEILGKMDRVTDTAVYDWKTGGRKPSKFQRHGIQFYLYAWAFEKLYDGVPKNVYYGALNSGSLIPLDIKPRLMQNMGDTINYVVDNMDKEPIRAVGYQCFGCFYKEICFAQLDGAWTKF